MPEQEPHPVYEKCAIRENLGLYLPMQRCCITRMAEGAGDFWIVQVTRDRSRVEAKHRRTCGV